MNTNLEPVILSSANFEIRDQYLNSDRAQSVLGWRPEVKFEDGLRETIEWYRSFFAKEEASL
jgi:CDP-glucose 4,6-dehydratase